MKAPSQIPASDASVSYLMNLLVGEERSLFKSQLLNARGYGLDQPQATIEVKLKIKELIS